MQSRHPAKHPFCSQNTQHKLVFFWPHITKPIFLKNSGKSTNILSGFYKLRCGRFSIKNFLDQCLVLFFVLKNMFKMWLKMRFLWHASHMFPWCSNCMYNKLQLQLTIRVWVSLLSRYMWIQLPLHSISCWDNDSMAGAQV